MPKLRRGDLKQIVKECLVEILAEGLENTQSSLVESRVITSEPPVRQRRKPARPTHEKFERAVSRNVSALTDDPMMAALFEDTARGTYQDQLANDGAPGKVSMQETAAPGADLAEVFGEQAAQNWASLAFDAPSKKTQV
tara:strand:+ start:1421 stop:1837 length:417 start_codon:yes stop_codon:yes gene_type:complete